MKLLVVKAVLGFLFLILVMALAVFLPAGSLRFWQAWLYLAVFSLSTLLITVYLILCSPQLLASRVKAGPSAESRKSQRIIQTVANLCFLLLHVVPGLDFRFHWTTVRPVISLIADAMVALGFVVVFLVFRENRYASATIEVAPEQTVIASGPYSVVRHPMYSGAGILILSTSPALGSWAALPFALLLILVVIARLRDEEKFLCASLQGYQEYRRKVPYRLVPFIW